MLQTSQNLLAVNLLVFNFSTTAKASYNELYAVNKLFYRTEF